MQHAHRQSAQRLRFTFEQRIENDRRRDDRTGLEAAARAIVAVKLDVQSEQENKRNQHAPDDPRDEVVAQALGGILSRPASLPGALLARVH